jgi:AcrR family transcriptional regulator
MAGDSAGTKKRLLEAAAAEFAEFGIAGARVDRIARAARANKQLIYAYFGSKDVLFDTVFSAYVGAALAEVDFDATDLPAYAGRLFDQSQDHPAVLRLATWYRLERPHGAGLQAVASVNRLRLERLRRAQEDGVLPSHFSPVQLLALIQAIATSWVTMNPEFGAAAATTDRDERRQTVVEAVRRLLAGAAVSAARD